MILVWVLILAHRVFSGGTSDTGLGSNTGRQENQVRTSDTGLGSNTGRQENQVRTSDTGLGSNTGTQGIQWGN